MAQKAGLLRDAVKQLLGSLLVLICTVLRLPTVLMMLLQCCRSMGWQLLTSSLPDVVTGLVVSWSAACCWP